MYCKDASRTGEDESIQFDFPGITFWPRKALNLSVCASLSILSVPSNLALERMSQTIRLRYLPLKCSWSLSDLARRFSSIIRGRMNYYRFFRQSALKSISFHPDIALAQWAVSNYKRMRAQIVRTGKCIGEMSQHQQDLFPHVRRSST